MPRHYENITVDEILDYEEPVTAVMSRYDRIMQHRTVQAMDGLAGHLEGVMAAIRTAAQIVQKSSDDVMRRADDAIARADSAAIEQRKQHASMKWLTIALVGSTGVYTGINAISAYQVYRGNQIQARIAETAHDQVDAMRRANEIQQKAAGNTP